MRETDEENRELVSVLRVHRALFIIATLRPLRIASIAEVATLCFGDVAFWATILRIYVSSVLISSIGRDLHLLFSYASVGG